MKKFVSGMLAFAMMLSCAACGGQQSAAETTPNTSAPADAGGGKEIVLRLGYENSATEPLGQAYSLWAERIAEEGDGSLVLETYPDSQLGDKNALIDSMGLGEAVIVGGDPAFLAEHGAPDLGILFGPFLFNSVEECNKLAESEWFAEQCKLLENNGLKIIAANWVSGTRHLLTKNLIETPDDLKGQKIRVPDNKIQLETFNKLGATATPMNLSDVYSALQSGVIDGSENPLSALYSKKFVEVSPYLLLTGHVRVINMLVMSADVFNSMSPEQQELLVSTCKEVGDEYNKMQEDSDSEYLELMKEQGAIVTEMTPETEQMFIDKSQAFYDMGSEFGWSDGLYETVRAAIDG